MAGNMRIQAKVAVFSRTRDEPPENMDVMAGQWKHNGKPLLTHLIKLLIHAGHGFTRFTLY